MIDRKFILYILVGIIAFALWSTWQKEYGKNEKQKSAVVTESTNSKNHVANNFVAKNTIKTAEQTTPADRLIEVTTDVFVIAIDPIGGNVVRVGLLKYFEKLDKKTPVLLLDNAADRYYVIQTSLVGKHGPDFENKQTIYSSKQQKYALSPGKNNLEVDLTWSSVGGVSVTKKFIFTKGKYDFAVNYDVVNNSKSNWEGKLFAQIKRKKIDVPKSMFAFNTYVGAAVSSPEIPYEKVSFSKIEELTKEKEGFIREGKEGWVSIQQRYFLSTIIPEKEQFCRYFGDFSNDIYSIGFSGSSLSVPTGQKATVNSVVYVGPEIAENIAPLANGLDRTVDYGRLFAISVAFFWVLKKLYLFVGNWGLSIILVTILIKLAFYKLSESSCRSMAKMRDLMPKMQALKERYADDKQKLHQATMDLYKQEKINPLNLGGCLPMLIQIPFFIALYYVLISAVELRHSPFVFWIHDLSARDPYYVLPILMGLSMVLQQRLTPTTADPTQAKMMMLMPVVFTVFFLNFPSGLVLYWLASNLLSILQQWYINRKLATAKKA